MKRNVDFMSKGKKVGTLNLIAENNESAKLYFYGDIVSDSWQSEWYEEDKCPQDIVDFFADIDKYKNVDIYINSGGGSVFAGIAIYNILKRHQGKKTVHIDGLAASIASVIALAGDEVICPASAEFMIHKPWIYGFTGNADDFRRTAQQLDVAQESIVAIYMAHVREGVTEEEIVEKVNAETWLTGTAAAELFNITVTEVVEMAACADSLYFDKYRNTPENIRTPKRTDDDNDEVEMFELELELLKLKY